MMYLDKFYSQLESTFYSIIDTYIDLYYTSQHGLILTDIRNITFALLMIRFVMDVLNKNVVTAGAITIICSLTVFMWDRELVHTIRIWRDCWEFAPYYRDMTWQSMRLDDHDKWKQKDLGSSINRMVPSWHQPHMIVWYSFVNLFNRQDVQMEEFRTDPISMWVSALRLPDDNIVIYTYYKCFNIYIPGFIKAFKVIWFNIRSLSQYTFITRIGKKYCPYFFRWHFTFEMVYEGIAAIFERMVVRAIWYWQEGVWNHIGHLCWEGRCEKAGAILEYPRFTHKHRMISISVNRVVDRSWEEAFRRWNWNEAYYEIDRLVFYNKALILLTQVIVYSHMLMILSGMFHAAFGQYMYLAFITENTERHVEPRDKNLRYCTGCTAWQDVPLTVRASMFPPKFWWGWFSRGTDKENIFLYVPKQIIKMILRKLRNFLRKLKRKI